ncbi:MAG: hypothetical protein JW708_06695 [Vallitaleaceae bacterium]|nr:hypothetical protein [Vallitaleaceae bacterium]
MNEKERILEMIEQGKITAKEGLELLNAIEETKVEEEKNELLLHRGKYKNLKVLVIAEKDHVNVNVNIPLELIKLVGGVAKDFAKYIPEGARGEIADKGVDLSALDFERIIRSLEDGSLENPTLVDVDVDSATEGKVLVKIYVE